MLLVGFGSKLLAEVKVPRKYSRKHHLQIYVAAFGNYIKLTISCELTVGR